MSAPVVVGSVEPMLSGLSQWNPIPPIEGVSVSCDAGQPVDVLEQGVPAGLPGDGQAVVLRGRGPDLRGQRGPCASALDMGDVRRAGCGDGEDRDR